MKYFWLSTFLKSENISKYIFVCSSFTVPCIKMILISELRLFFDHNFGQRNRILIQRFIHWSWQSETSWWLISFNRCFSCILSSTSSRNTSSFSWALQLFIDLWRFCVDWSGFWNGNFNLFLLIKNNIPLFFKLFDPPLMLFHLLLIMILNFLSSTFILFT